MGKGRAGNMLGVGGTRSPLPRKKMRGNRDTGGHGPGGSTDLMAQKRELLRRLRESRAERESQEARE